MTLPAGFTQMTPEEMSSRFGRATGKPPLAAYADKQRHAVIVFTSSPGKKPYTDSQLAEFLKLARQAFEKRLEGLSWHKDEVISVNGRSWGRMHYSVKNRDTDARNDTYMTQIPGAMFSVNLSAPVDRWPSSQPVLMAAFKSIRIKE
ncbi:MAG: hypothetical protein REI94_02315 [Moraxellaceae bacterium]|nr:hypothetical protein [Moraxellaceae bacterium]